MIQNHYDFGLRAVRSVLNAVNKLKTCAGAGEPDDDGTEGDADDDAQELKLILRAFLDVNLPKFVSDDLPLVNGIIKDMFPSLK